MSQSQRQGPPAPGETLFQSYPTVPGVFDEMVATPTAPRLHWRPFMASLDQLGTHELASRWESGRRMIREHDVTYNVYGDPQGMDRPWGLDLVPLLIAAQDWKRVEAGLSQRSRLLNEILLDCYGGSQRLLRDGFLPPELVYANPGFLRPCRGIEVPKNVYLHLHACDLARSADGNWWVLSDRTQAPSGAGYALENRTVVSRLLPDELRDHRVERLAGFFRLQREMLLKLAPQGRENPSVVLLTPGPHNETYFEHAYLARHLGFPLVEGADLTVRDSRVFLKTLEGLQPVDVILRRVDDSFCDPLELRSESFLGVAGLVEATRAGHVTVANALGTGLLESPALLAFLPGLCRHLFDEELLLPSVATWWCGQADEMRYVLEHLDELVVKPTFGAARNQPWFGGRLSEAERNKLKAMIRARPRDFIGQERVVLSHAPVWSDQRLETRSIVVRTYVANGGDSLAVLPGGLTRVARTTEDPVVSMQSGGGSKDTWVLGNGSPSRVEVASAVIEARPAERVVSGVPSRAADNLFWLGRYTERLEQTLRVLRCVLGRLSDESTRDGTPELAALGGLLGRLGVLPAALPTDFVTADLLQPVLQLVYQPELSGGIRELLGRIRFISSTVRDRFSGDTWRILGRLDTDARPRKGRLPTASALTLIHNLVLDLAAFNGMEMENMTRGHGWRFLDLGRRVERAVRMVALLRAAASLKAPPASVLEPVLEIADSVMTYRRRHFAEPRWPEVVDLLLRDSSNPRALAFQIMEIRNHSGALPQPVNVREEHIEALQVRGLLEALQLGRTETLSPDRAELMSWLDRLGTELSIFSDDLTNRYFSHTVPRIS